MAYQKRKFSHYLIQDFRNPRRVFRQYVLQAKDLAQCGANRFRRKIIS
jgi:hypothetical protein